MNEEIEVVYSEKANKSMVEKEEELIKKLRIYCHSQEDRGAV